MASGCLSFLCWLQHFTLPGIISMLGSSLLFHLAATLQAGLLLYFLHNSVNPASCQFPSLCYQRELGLPGWDFTFHHETLKQMMVDAPEAAFSMIRSHLQFNTSFVVFTPVISSFLTLIIYHILYPSKFRNRPWEFVVRLLSLLVLTALHAALLTAFVFYSNDQDWNATWSEMTAKHLDAVTFVVIALAITWIDPSELNHGDRSETTKIEQLYIVITASISLIIFFWLPEIWRLFFS